MVVGDATQEAKLHGHLHDILGESHGSMQMTVDGNWEWADQ